MKVRGSAKNRVFACGPLRKLLHFNGLTWESYETTFAGSGSLIFGAIHVFQNSVFIGGSGGVGFDSKGIILRGK